MLAEMVMETEGSREVGEAGEGWGETHSQQAVEELYEWLLQGNDSVAALPPRYGRKDRAKTFPPSSTTTRVEELLRKRRGFVYGYATPSSRTIVELEVGVRTSSAVVARD